jgi:putative phosphoesterase
VDTIKKMRIGVLSDTHLSNPDPLLDHILEDLLTETEMILHAGDIVGRRVLDRLEEVGAIAVCGNMDHYDILDRVPQIRIISAGGKRIGLIHGWGSKDGLAQRILKKFDPDRPDLIVYGHSHEPFWGKVDGTHMFNPGSAGYNHSVGLRTVGILDVSENSMEGRFLSIGS